MRPRTDRMKLISLLTLLKNQSEYGLAYDRAVIPSAGPWITDKEVNTADAVRNGWYDNWSGYIDLFERAFARFIGVRHAISLELL